jgi:tRNA threonylcarbamoyladenosine biosynthesis protein TsaB
MALFIFLETSTTMCSVALSEDSKLLALKEINGDYTHAENLTLFVSDVLASSGKKMSDLDAVIVSKGPGSYTGLRIGVSAAKGLCYALDKPLIAVNTLESMTQLKVVQDAAATEDVLYLCPMIDARRMEVYCAIFDRRGNQVVETSADIIDESSFSDLLQKGKVLFFGDGAAKCKGTITHKNALFLDGVYPSAESMIPFALRIYKEKVFESVAYFEPFYLKNFIAGKKKSVE